MKPSLTYDNAAHAALRFPRASSAQIAAFAARWEVSLPTDYVDFLTRYNGGSFAECFFKGSALGDLVVSRFYTLADSEHYSIENSLNNLDGYVPSKFVPVAADPGGNLFLLALDSAHFGKVYFWNHERPAFSEDGAFEDFDNLTLLADSFDQFLSHLTK
jgi:SMI1 / KNR4 family (SUKH-1)